MPPRRHRRRSFVVPQNLQATQSPGPAPAAQQLPATELGTNPEATAVQREINPPQAVTPAVHPVDHVPLPDSATAPQPFGAVGRPVATKNPPLNRQQEPLPVANEGRDKVTEEAQPEANASQEQQQQKPPVKNAKATTESPVEAPAVNGQAARAAPPHLQRNSRDFKNTKRYGRAFVPTPAPDRKATGAATVASTETSAQKTTVAPVSAAMEQMRLRQQCVTPASTSAESGGLSDESEGRKDNKAEGFNNMNTRKKPADTKARAPIVISRSFKRPYTLEDAPRAESNAAKPDVSRVEGKVPVATTATEKISSYADINDNVKAPQDISKDVEPQSVSSAGKMASAMEIPKGKGVITKTTVPVGAATPQAAAVAEVTQPPDEERVLQTNADEALQKQAAEEATSKPTELASQRQVESARRRSRMQAARMRARKAAMRKRMEEAARKKAEEALKREAEQEAAQKRAREEAKRRAEEEAARKRAEEEAEQKRAQEEAQRQAEEEATRKQAEEEAARKRAENARRRESAREALKKRAEEAARKRAEEMARKRAERAARRQAEEAAAKKLAEEEEARRVAEEEIAQKRAEEEAARKRLEEEAARKKAEEEAARKKAEGGGEEESRGGSSKKEG
uniref:Uncharacterized protein TCIL3000_8_7370 n=1 Tax=Trypanosoma congolense (strain IL3000) TaxID=1068625 RepID=G0USZ5_TRYCI|nr:unnamed protein product [Trypanosoma congolense IL3000]